MDRCKADPKIRRDALLRLQVLAVIIVRSGRTDGTVPAFIRLKGLDSDLTSMNPFVASETLRIDFHLLALGSNITSLRMFMITLSQRNSSGL